LLKLYMYGYLYRIRSSRALEREAKRNVEVMWLLRGLAPGYRTIGNFRKENWKGFKAANREFEVLTRALGRLGGERVAIDGGSYDGNASKASIKTGGKDADRLDEIDREIEAYGAAIEANDKAEGARSPSDRNGGGDGGEDITQKLAG